MACTEHNKIKFYCEEKLIKEVITNGFEYIETPDIPEKEGYVIDGWYIENTNIQFNPSAYLYYKIDYNINVVAKYSKDDYYLGKYYLSENEIKIENIKIPDIPGSRTYYKFRILNYEDISNRQLNIAICNDTFKVSTNTNNIFSNLQDFITIKNVEFSDITTLTVYYDFRLFNNPSINIDCEKFYLKISVF